MCCCSPTGRKGGHHPNLGWPCVVNDEVKSTARAATRSWRWRSRGAPAWGAFFFIEDKIRGMRGSDGPSLCVYFALRTLD